MKLQGDFHIRWLAISDITPRLMENFAHSQKIAKKWVKKTNIWELTDTSLLREWNAEKRIWITEYMCQQIDRGGVTVESDYSSIIFLESRD